ncbi:hypothetical protein BRD56_02540 [Thermoplasmatales archaeon SW_10_69_26]|nr:MAG: hypothetical protein BRD56_02540 [Thermoplasmatales archaeon SW_10_69_26]
MPSIGCSIEPSPYHGHDELAVELQIARGEHEAVLAVLGETGTMREEGVDLAFWDDLIHVLIPIEEGA